MVFFLKKKKLKSISYHFIFFLFLSSLHFILVGEVKLNLPKMLEQKDKSVTGLTKGIEMLFKQNKVIFIYIKNSENSENSLKK